MQGYDGVESVVYKAFAKVRMYWGFLSTVLLRGSQVMEQIEGGDLVVNRGDESKPKESEESDPKRDLNVVDNYDTALKLSQVCTTAQNTGFGRVYTRHVGELGRGREAESPTSCCRCLNDPKPHHLFLRLPSHSTLLLILHPRSREIVPVPPVPPLSFRPEPPTPPFHSDPGYTREMVRSLGHLPVG